MPNVLWLGIRTVFLSTSLSTKHKAPSLHVTPHNAKPVLGKVIYYILRPM
ncbi:MAG: hypothetical protein KIT33_14695 [Candidatus Kapabacteria bacterium]|nr:hypothetical protein [Candidatus Kapabacteria bacterium]